MDAGQISASQIRHSRSRNAIQGSAAHAVGLYDTKLTVEANFRLGLHQVLESLKKYRWGEDAVNRNKTTPHDAGRPR
jgi:hypothetical protein